MAVSLGFGLLFATVLILVALPCFYLVADDLRHIICNFMRRLLGKEPVTDKSSAICVIIHKETDNDA